MTPEQESAINSMIAIAIPVLLILLTVIVYHVTAKKAHKQNMKDLNSRYSMPKK